MLVPLRWLSEYVDLPADPTDLAGRLTVAGLEVTGVRAVGVPPPAGVRVTPGDIAWEPDKVVVANVLGIDKHPQADTLKMVRLDTGAGEPKTVITGAPNIAVGTHGQTVVLGLKGSTYFGTDKAGQKAVLTLVPKALRGIDNDAMCMSNFELGIADDHDGIILLDDGDAEPGTPARDLLGDVILDLDVLPNMARCLGLIGVAREVAALTGRGVTLPAAPPVLGAGEPLVRVEIADAALCPRYTATVVRGVTVGPAPRWMRSRLLAVGQRPIDVVVDVTNYVMFETAQPLHAFDYDVLVQRAGGGVPAINVRPARAGEVLVTLDGAERLLTPDNLVIADTAGPVALAGVMGGRDTQVTAATTALLVEAATFDPVGVRRTARQFNLFSEAATRFTRGLHPASAEFAARRAFHLLTAHAGGTAAGPLVDVYPGPPPVRVIDLTRGEIERVLGVRLPDEEVVPVLEALQFTVKDTLWGWAVTVPPGRLDIQAGAADLIEEVARIGGYDRLPTRLLPFELPAPRVDRSAELEDAVRDALADAGLFEAVTYSLTSPADDAKLRPPSAPAESPAFVTLVNPVSAERSVLRRSLLPGLLAVAAENLKHGPRVALFEAGPVYLPRAGELLPEEPRRLAVVLAGPRTESPWDASAPAPAADFYDLKGVVEGLAAHLHLPDVGFESAADVPHLHPGRAARLTVAGTAVGALGELHPQVGAAFGFKGVVVAAEFDLDALLAAVPPRFGYVPVSPFEKVLRDVAVVVPEATPADRVLAEVRAGGAALLESVNLFDVYRGESIPAGTKSLAYALAYRLPDRELTAKEVDTAHKKVEGRLRHVLGAKIRGQD